VQAGTAQFVLLDYDCGLAQLRSANGSGVTGAAATEYYEIEVLFGHSIAPCLVRLNPTHPVVFRRVQDWFRRLNIQPVSAGMWLARW